MAFLWKNFFIRLCSALCKRRFSQKKGGTKNILVISTTAVGDTLWATPALRNLKESFPQSVVTVLVSPLGREILENNPYIDEIVSLEKPFLFSFFFLLFKFYKISWDSILIFHASQRAVFFLAALLDAKNLIGISGKNKGLDKLFTTLVEPKTQEHEIQKRLRMTEKVGAKKNDRYELSFVLLKEEKKKAFLQKPLIIFHPGAANSYKRWPEEHFIALGKLLQKKLNCSIAITGVPKEKLLVETIASALFGAQSFLFSSIRDLAIFLHQADLLITNDTGPLHLASALRIPLIGIFGATDPSICGPLQNKNSLTVRSLAHCKQCLFRKCPYPHCLEKISPEEIQEAALSLLPQDAHERA